MTEQARVRVDSLSAAEDLGLIGLRDLAAAAAGTDYRVVGGHMVQFLQLVYPTATAARATADVDAALHHEVEAAGRDLHEALTRGGYTAVEGNRYERTEDGAGTVVIDLLVNTMGTRKEERLFAGRRVDAVPGLTLAVSEPPLRILADVRLRSGDALELEVPVPGVEAALVLKSAAWASRLAAKDLADIATLLEIVGAHRDRLEPWGLASTRARGSRKDACRTLHSLAEGLDRKRVRGLPRGSNPARTAPLIRAHVQRVG